MNVEQNAVVMDMELTAVELELVNGGSEQQARNFENNVNSSLNNKTK